MTTSQQQVLAVALIVSGAIIQFALTGISQNAQVLGITPALGAWLALILGGSMVGITVVLNYLPSPKQHAEITGLQARNQRLAALAPERREETPPRATPRAGTRPTTSEPE
mgnify:CR=1 FL=1